MQRDPEDIVAAGYDLIADRYLQWSDEVRGDPSLRLLEELISRLPQRPAVLDLGCGAGTPCTALLAERGEVTGVDLSARQLELARAAIPTVRFLRADMSTVEFPPATFDAVTAFYSITHVPRAQQGNLFRRIATWLRPGGLFLASLGAGAMEGTVPDWLGTPMYFSSHAAATNRNLLAQVGLRVLIDEEVTMTEPEGPVTFQWVIAARE
ncbi:class I SAM-dependent DNA methyltransferase [Nocardia transvalensis]|uniref:class I SAM-dependent DNA methyltransferase n=1 Tax=Nocardia transvalensis TaxID=37333 RepID=UPI001893C3CE|nr:class I SAM-dependent methyltransferase [Nocardia transvalensis]MBF6329571.1 class I SAM-dependent methyltransferase [Nocardia transvalensis]